MKPACPQEYLPEPIIVSIAKQIFEDLFQYTNGIEQAFEYTETLANRFENTLRTIPFSPHQATLLVWHYRDSSPTNSLGYGTYALEISLQEAIEVLRSAQRLIVEYASDLSIHETSHATILARTIGTLRVNANSIRGLRNLKIYYLLDLVLQTKDALLHTPHLGEGSVREIEQELSHYNLNLGMQIDIGIVTEARTIIKNMRLNVS